MSNPSGPVDLDAVTQLVEQLDRDLARARTGSGSIDTLRVEVEQLRSALAADSPSDEEVTQGLTTVRSRLHDLGDELETDAIIGADYLRRIGRLLGLT